MAWLEETNIPKVRFVRPSRPPFIGGLLAAGEARFRSDASSAVVIYGQNYRNIGLWQRVVGARGHLRKYIAGRSRVWRMCGDEHGTRY